MENDKNVLDKGPFFHGTKVELKLGVYSFRIVHPIIRIKSLVISILRQR